MNIYQEIKNVLNVRKENIRLNEELQSYKQRCIKFENQVAQLTNEYENTSLELTGLTRDHEFLNALLNKSYNMIGLLVVVDLVLAGMYLKPHFEAMF
jgi:hypothetical protein